MRNANSIGLKPISNVASIPNPAEAELPPEEERVVDRSIGSYLQELRQLDDEQIAAILTHHRSKGMRFGEAAVALRMASREDVLWALSQQFHYPYASGDGKRFHEELVAAIDPFDAQTEALRGVRSQLMLGVMASDQPARALSVLSPNVGDGRSFFAANLAIVFSQLGERTLLIDADMRKPKQHLLFGVPNQSGLSNMLLGRPESSVIHRVPDLPSLFVLPVGTVPPNPLELLQRPAFKLLMQELLKKFDHVVVDTPPNTQGADARVVAAQCGIALVLGRRGATRMKAVSSLINEVARGPATVAGVVINEH